MKLRATRVFSLAATSALSAEALAAAPRYAMVLDASQAAHGVQTVSLVANPAIQRSWVALAAVTTTAAKRVHLSTEGQKQVLTGPALLPGQEILRLDEAGNPFYITFDATTIEGTARQFAAQGRHNSTNQGHAVGLSGNVMYESWIVADPANDKASALGLDVPAGTWMLSAHIPDADYWQKEVVSGNVTGFSIEGLFDSVQLNLSAAAPAPTPVPEKKWYQKLTAKLSALGKEKAAEIHAALGLEQLADGRAISIDDTTGAVTVAADGSALPDGEYDLMNGGKLVVAGGVRQDGEQPAATDNPVVAAADASTADAPAAVPAPLAPGASAEELIKAVNELIGLVKKDATDDAQAPTPPANPASAPAGQKMAAQLHGVEVVSLKLDAIELADGDKLTLNPVSKRLAHADGSLVESGYFAAADGSYFQVSTDQWFYQISKQTYDQVYGAKLQAVKLAELEAKLATAPAGKKVLLGGEESIAPALTPAQVRLARAEATR